MAMRKAFTGGACAPGGQEQTMGNNAFTNMIDYMVSGGASASQKAEGFVPQMDSSNIAQMEAAYADQQKMEAMTKQFDAMSMPQQVMPQAPAPQEHISQPNIDQMNNLWNNPVETNKHADIEAIEHKFSNMPVHAQNFTGLPGMMGPMMYPPMGMGPQTMAPTTQQPTEEIKVEEVPEVVKVDDQMLKDDMKESTAYLINKLSQVPSEKMQNSQFLGFLKQMNSGALEVDENGLKENPQKMKEFEDAALKKARMDAEWYKDPIDGNLEETKENQKFYGEEGIIKEKDPFTNFDPHEFFKDSWNADELKEDELQKMMANWKAQAMKSQDFYEETLTQPPTETVIQVPKVDHFKFEEDNPYSNVEDAYTLACQLNEELKVHDAILALKAHLTKEPEHAPSWRMLGQLYQENDEDDKAIAYLLKAYELDPYDCESLLYLGVSCTNELNPKVAMNHLLDWLRYHLDYSDLPIPQEHIEDQDLLRDELRGLLNQALAKNPNDVDVLICLGVVEFGERNYRGAAEYFGQAVEREPNNYNYCNKLGAALANHLRTDDALQMYDRALALRPNLVRTWANVGVAYCNRDRFDEAAGKFMNAIALNPDAEHLWKHLHACFWATKEFEKCEQVKKRNIEYFRGEYDIINPEMLQRSEL
ncbi:unnamed protein product [Moneuplotes crassus]|uniref:Peroxin-5 n=2 Tax=Euplotes crassus TaxID=5936 RepID=A0AAD1U9X8_EUPCR|nr:unnamed protein product [Moneuplotes crassus]